MNIFEKYKDYVIFSSIKKELSIVYFTYNENYVAIHTNRPEWLNWAFDSNFLCNNCKNGNLIGKITIYFDENLFEKRYDYDTYADGEFVLKSHPMYVEGVTNSFFEIEDLEIHVFHYPRKIISINNKRSFEFSSFVCTKEDLIRESLYGIKKILSRYNHYKGVFSIHAAALSRNEKGYLFLSGSRVGKSTLFVNLFFDGFEPINDDIVFWSYKHGKIVIHGCATLPQLRKNTFDAIIPHKSMPTDNLLEYQSNFNYYSLYGCKLNKRTPLDAIFIPQFGYAKSSIERIKNLDVFKKELRACIAHGNYEIDESFLEAIKSLNAVPTFKFCMSADYNEVCSTLNNFLVKL